MSRKTAAQRARARSDAAIAREKAHTEVVNEVFAPTVTDLHAARSLLASPPEGYAGAIAPRLAHARQVIHRAGVFGIDS